MLVRSRLVRCGPSDPEEADTRFVRWVDLAERMAIIAMKLNELLSHREALGQQ